MLLDGLVVVLVATRFPENIGMVARACANMGCPQIILVDPKRWIKAKAEMLATPKGLPWLDNLVIAPSLSLALQNQHQVYGTTARTGGWRREIQSPRKASQRIATQILEGKQVALVFGPEDRGLTNEEIQACHELITIPTDQASSLNLAQAVLIVLYEIAQASRELKGLHLQKSPTITYQELSLFLDYFKEALINLDYLHGDNVDYFFQPWKRLFSRLELNKHEFAALMGLCRQINNKFKIKES
ncbi:MAG: RNA methyltransferase [Desulfovibrionaceae bacterium]|nr:RNA methyltransferase [Desulfovibrionaceae bacterium]